MNILPLVGPVIGLIKKFMDGRKTKTGVALAVAGGAVGTLSVLGVDVTPIMVANGMQQLLALFDIALQEEAAGSVGVLFGALMTVVGNMYSLYGYHRKGKLATKG
jgi:hypothetical protein